MGTSFEQPTLKIQKYLNQKNCQPVQNPLTLYYLRVCPPPILSHPMLALPLLYHTLCMPSPYSIQPMHVLSLILSHPSPCMPSPYSIPAHACPPSYSIPAHAWYPLFYRSPCMPSPPILSQPKHTLPHSVPPLACCLSILYPPPTSPHVSLQYSILFQPMHAHLTCHIHLEGMFLL